MQTAVISKHFLSNPEFDIVIGINGQPFTKKNAITKLDDYSEFELSSGKVTKDAAIDFILHKMH